MLRSVLLRPLLKLLFMGGLLLAGAVAVWHYENKWSEKARLIEENRRLEERNKHLQQFVTRLTTERRVAEIIVTDQPRNGSDIQSTTLLFLEYARDGVKLLPPRFFTIKGNIAHIDSLVIKFEQNFIENNDPLRGHSIALFYRLYGDYQTPSDAFRIDEPGKVPPIYDQPDMPAAAREFELELWQNFWKLADDEKYRQQMGVKTVHGESPWMPFHPDRIYTLTLATNGGLSLTSRPMDGLLKEFRDALRKDKDRSAGNPQ